MDVEMANLRLKSDKIEILKVELTHGVPINRTERLASEEYNISSGSFLGAPLKTFTRKDGKNKHSILDNMFVDYRPYNLAVTTLVSSPMKFFVYNQNRSAIIFGNNSSESV